MRRRALAIEIEIDEPNGVARRFLDRTLPSLEAEVCNLADEIAYNAHDIDDGVRSGLLDYEQLLELPAFERFHAQALHLAPTLGGRRLLYAALRHMLSALVHDLVESSTQALENHAPMSADEARVGPLLITFSDQMSAELRSINTFLRRALYRHERVVRTTEVAKRLVRELFDAYLDQPGQLPAEHAARLPVQQTAVDYIAGMTDRFALKEHHRLTGITIDLA